VASVTVCVSVCLRLSVRALKGKRLELSTLNSVNRPSASNDPEVKRSNLKVMRRGYACRYDCSGLFDCAANRQRTCRGLCMKQAVSLKATICVMPPTRPAGPLPPHTSTSKVHKQSLVSLSLAFITAGRVTVGRVNS